MAQIYFSSRVSYHAEIVRLPQRLVETEFAKQSKVQSRNLISLGRQS